eukprot:1185423-Prorocentrum_minimum.AAC.4
MAYTSPKCRRKSAAEPALLTFATSILLKLHNIIPRVDVKGHRVDAKGRYTVDVTGYRADAKGRYTVGVKGHRVDAKGPLRLSSHLQNITVTS